MNSAKQTSAPVSRQGRAAEGDEVRGRRLPGLRPLYNTCCVLSVVKALPGSLLIPFTGTGQINVTAVDSCSGGTVTVTESASFSSTNPAIADVGPNNGLVEGVGVGTATVHTDLEYFEFASPADPCALAQFAKDHGTTVNPTVTISCTKQHLALGPTAPAATKTGSCTTTASPAGGSYTWSAPNRVSLNAGGGAASYTAANQSSGTGDTVITVTYTVNNRSASAQSAPITVHKPTSLSLDSDSTNPTGTTCNAPCLDNPNQTCTYSSYLKTRIYTTQSHLAQTSFPSVGLTSIVAQESFTGFTSSCGASLPQTESAGTATFNDRFFFCSSACLQGGGGCTNTATQTLTVNGLVVRTPSVTWTCSSATVTP